MAKYEMLIAASGKRGSALLPCVVVEEKGIKRAAVRAKAMARACYPEYEKFNVVKMNEKGLMEQSNVAIKAALELYAADHGKLNDGDSFTTKLNNCVLTISLKDGSLDVQFDPDADVAVDTPYTLDMKLDIYEEEDNG